jgi:site-specific recombinase XerD
MRITEAFDAYRSDVIVFKNQSGKTEENHYVCMRALIKYFGDIDIESLSFAMVRDWKLDLDKSRSIETTRNYIIKLRVVLTFCRSRGINCLRPEDIPVPKRSSRVPDFVTPEEVQRLIDGCDVPRSRRLNRLRNRTIISLLYASGIRVSELCGLDRSSIHDDNSFTVIGKGSKARLCFLDERTSAYLSDYLRSRPDNHPALFVSDHNIARITPGGVQEIFKFARRRAGIPVPVHPHTMRHSFATNLLRNNTNIRYVQVMLGHASLETTQMYTHVVDKDLQAIYQSHHTI